MKKENLEWLVVNTRSRLDYVAPLEPFWSSDGFTFKLIASCTFRQPIRFPGARRYTLVIIKTNRPASPFSH